MTVGVHWMRGTTVQDGDSVLEALSSSLEESVVVLDHGHYGYAAGYLVGGVKVYEHPDRPDMGVCVEVDGATCEALGVRALEALRSSLGLRLSRLDLALDHCPFAPGELRNHWQAGQVRTRAKVPKDAREDRQWRTCSWRESPTGDTFSMGSRSSTQYARCYDSRGFTRLELELSDRLADDAAGRLFSVLEDPSAFALEALAWVRRFVDFVDASAAAHASRRPLLPFWELFVRGASKARVQLEGSVRRTLEEVRGWVAHQVAPALALLERGFGWNDLRSLVEEGRSRWTGRHLATLAAAGLSP